MYKWPKEVPFTIFSDCSIESIAFSSNTITLEFSNGNLVTVESSLAVARGDEAWSSISVPPTSPVQLDMIGKSITDSELDSDGSSLILYLDNSLRLRLKGDDQNYECFHLRIDGVEHVV